jgi:hypothetical protein
MANAMLPLLCEMYGVRRRLVLRSQELATAKEEVTALGAAEQQDS